MRIGLITQEVTCWLNLIGTPLWVYLRGISLEADMGTNLLKRGAGLLLDKLMGGDMEKRLANLEEQEP